MRPAPIRLTVLKVVFLLNFLYVGSFAARGLWLHSGPWDPLRGVAYSFWGALALLSILGIRRPLAMVPLLLLQLVYKAIWLTAIYFPSGSGAGLLPVMLAGAIVDIAVIPWPYVYSTYIKGSADHSHGSVVGM